MKTFSKLRVLSRFQQNKTFMTGTIGMFIVAFVSLILAFFTNWILGFVWFVLLVAFFATMLKGLIQAGQSNESYLEELTYRVKLGQQEAILEMPMGIILLGKGDRIVWVNPYLQDLLADQDLIGESLSEADGDLAFAVKNYADDKVNRFSWLDRSFDMAYQEQLGVIYLLDVSQNEALNRDLADHRLVTGLVSVDNYEEVTEGMPDSETSKLRTYVTGQLTDWAKKYHLYVRRLSPVTYLLMGYQRDLAQAEDEKFSVVKTVREATAQQNSPLTLSMGIAYGEQDINSLVQLAQTNLDLALGRGGDQVVVKAEDMPARFYGGTTNPMEKRTRVRARVISQTIAELMDQSDQVFVVGHQRPDMDAVGSAMGLWRFSQTRGKKAFVVVNEGEIFSDIQSLLATVRSDQMGEGEPGVDLGASIISEKESLDLATEKSLLILVDHAKEALDGAPDLLKDLKDRVVVIDHHRLAENGLPDKPMLTYIEPYASSTSELVTELLQYQNQKGAPITGLEATAMLGGIQVDTKNFVLRTGSRTFDAASYLRANGADNELLQSFLKEKFSDFKARAELIHLAEINNHSAIAVGDNDTVYQSVIAAQAADELLQVEGVKASFVLTKRDDGRVGISARSNGDFNVQTIMEDLGGGGHLSNAATQMSDVTTDEAADQLLQAISSQEAEEAE
ncbi:DHH family phosphoesterase [Fructobacillus evanidus]|uniref:Cyclic-di-AMP phosphodiesterase n=1 Tax=Fructobacillus evanidus TaxID=3064281 RepID=A0ABM9N0P0_9LACO|nr:Cyclic di-AMP phosphodiesterase GdpP [Fructobacillus sp. LMG 32999]CAK1247034.1 Cyclic di-AMP phosphodiesterase GdpP [Fructobacillus sp. LMG 32999]CAK1251945.1 Cyclic di-AMP phosphodiesterase GdpP [Fructobacillus sp. LMG 32999]CAK1252096.1 Cyclic di-AMP phosphodiesterase GdpP [Fructobacillus sp. LMG 32999]CAK1252170.1 Cyclic di-AMP phosphodiesterase GdpP [Fructobacillus sp. LMG 32999]